MMKSLKKIVNGPAALMSLWVSILVVSMTVMVILVTVNSFRITQEHNEYETAIHEKVNGDDGNIIISREDFEKLLEYKYIEANDYLAIILTLITLCVSLSAAIPYIVGKAVTSNQVKDTVEELYRKQKDDNERNIKKAIDKLEAAEGHLSRMIAYILMFSVKDENFKARFSSFNNYNPDHHPFWALGWASKGLIRYIKVAQSDAINTFAIERFCENCVKYIQDASVLIADISSKDIKTTSPTSFCDGKVLRAYVDLFDALGFYKAFRYNRKVGVLITEKKEKELNETLMELYKVLTPSAPGFYDESIAKEISKKSKYSQFLKDSDGSPASYTVLCKYIQNWCVKGEFDNMWY